MKSSYTSQQKKIYSDYQNYSTERIEELVRSDKLTGQVNQILNDILADRKEGSENHSDHATEVTVKAEEPQLLLKTINASRFYNRISKPKPWKINVFENKLIIIDEQEKDSGIVIEKEKAFGDIAITTNDDRNVKEMFIIIQKKVALKVSKEDNDYIHTWLLGDTQSISMAKDTMQKELKQSVMGWGIGLLVLGIIHIIFSEYLDWVWGIILCAASVPNFFIYKKGMFVLSGVIIILAALSNILYAIIDFPEYGRLLMLGVFQIGWGINEFQRFNVYKKKDEFLRWAENKISVIPT